MGRTSTVLALLVALVVGLTGAPALADETPAPQEPTTPPVPTVVWSQAEYATEVGRTVELQGTLTDPGDARPELVVERRAADDTWTAVESVRDGDTVRATVPGESAAYRLRAVVDGTTVAEATTQVIARAARTTVSLSLPSAVKDYAVATARVTWRRGFDQARPTGAAVLEWKPTAKAAYRTVTRLTVRDGTASYRFRPRHDGWFRVRTSATAGLAAATSSARYLDNRPPGKRVALPKGAPRPTLRLPAQPRHGRAAADATTSRISDAMWRSMKGRSWHSGCPVGRSDLRVVRVSYWAFDGYVRRGEIVVHRKVAKRTSRIFTDLFAKRVPIRSMYRVDRFGYSRKLKGADDYRSMRADNTSGFNCRQVVGRPGVRSPHARGRSIDINPWENPYHAGKWHPNGSWQKRSRPAAITWRGRNDPVVKVFRKHGFRWLAPFDLHHFQD